MAVKALIHEKCQECGARDARKIGARIQVFGHRCPYAPPGPGDGPRQFRADEVNFIPGDFTVAELSAELDEAWSIINDLRNKRWEAERAVLHAVQAATQEVYAPARMKGEG